MSSVRRGGPRSPLLSLRKVSASVGPLRILDEVGLEVHAGQVVALMGPSGAGKSTIASLILDEPAPGVLATGEIAVPRDARNRRRVGYLPQHAGATLNPSRRIGSALGELMALHRPQHCGRGRHGRRAAALQVLAEAAFVAEEGQDVLGRYPWEFSGGQRQRLALAQVLTLAPQLLVLDEPTAGLDPLSRAGVVSQVLAQRDRGLGVLLITHDPWVAEHAAEAVISLDAGRVVARRERRCERAGVAAGRAGRAVTEPAEGPGEAEPEAAGAPVGGTGEELVCWEGVSVEFGPVRALADVDLSLRRGEAIAVMGASGSGKSTLARVLAGLQTASAGQVRLEGRALPHAAARSREQRRRVQYVWQEASASFVPHRPVLDQCADTAVNLRRISRGPAREEALAWLAQVGLTPAQAKRVPQGLSGGQLQRAALVRALLARPDVLICDEVTTAVDTELAGVVAAAIQRYRQESGAGLVLISHDVDFVSSQADRWAVLSAGRIVSVDRPHALLTAATVATDPGCQAAPSVSGQASVSGGNSR